MRKQLTLLVGLILLLNGGAPNAANAAKTAKVPQAPGLHVVGADVSSQDVASILDMIQDLLAASNRHNLEDVLKHYSPRFVSGDNLTLEEVRHLIEDTWKLYPDIRYETRTLEIRVNGDWATVESMDTARATAKADLVLSATPGQLESHSRGLLFLRRVGKTWEILSDATIYENATILYGEAQKLKLNLSTPDQAFAGEPYTAKVDVAMPPGGFAIASISKEPLVFPQRVPQDKFRSLTDDQNTLERVFQANTTNNNEMITATIGLTQVGQDEQERPTVKLNGIATVVKRVNVLPKSKYAETRAQEEIIKRSASGAIDLTNSSPKPEAGPQTMFGAAPSAIPEKMEEDQEALPGVKPQTPVDEKVPAKPPSAPAGETAPKAPEGGR